MSDLSVIVAAAHETSRPGRCLQSLSAQGAPLGVEILYASPHRPSLDDLPGVTWIPVDRALLVPQLWGLGIARATSSYVAITNDSCIAPPGWVERAIRLIGEHPEMSGIGGPIGAPRLGGGRDLAAYLVRYHGYLDAEEGVQDEIPGDNAIYRRADLEWAWLEPEKGFWETLVHRQLKQGERQLYYSRDLAIDFESSGRAAAFTRQRFLHGRKFGATRELPSMARRMLAAMGAALVLPLLLLLRIWRLHRRYMPGETWRFLAALPWLALFLVSWSWGEASGYLLPRPHRD